MITKLVWLIFTGQILWLIIVNAQQQQLQWPVSSFSPEKRGVLTNYNSISTNNNNKQPINILLLLPVNDTYKFSLNKVLASLLLAIDDLKSTDYGSKFRIEIVTDSCDCGGIKAPVNAMENIFGKRNHTKQFQAVFGPMCD